MGITPKNWIDFFYDESEGLGIIYERVILHKIFRKIIKNYNIKSVLECPSFGMTGFSGINSWFFAKNNLEVYIADDDSKRLFFIRKIWKMANLNAKFIKINNYERLPFNSNQFDLVWNFAALWYLKHYDLQSVLKELARVCRKVLFISIPNKNLFYSLRKVIEKNFFHYVDENIINRDYIEPLLEKAFSNYNFKIVEKGYIDTPPWMDFAIKIKDVLGLSTKSDRIVLPEYYRYLLNPNLEKNVLIYSFLENLPSFLKRFWSHHVYYIFTKDYSD